MSNALSGKVAIVTGGASGIGRATVELFARENARVVIADVDVAQGEDLARALGDNVRFRRTDVASEDDVQGLIDFTVATFGGLHIMFNNAGKPSALFPSLLDDDFKDFHTIININLLGVMLGTQRAARHMARHGGGAIINTASIGGSVAGFGVTTYRAAKAGVIHFSKCAAIDLAQHNIRVNVLNPGHIRTRMSSWSQSGMTAEGFQRLQEELNEINMADQPIKQQATAEDAAHAVLYLASDHARMVTGTVIPVDGGTTVGDCVNHVEKILRAQAKAFGK